MHARRREWLVLAFVVTIMVGAAGIVPVEARAEGAFVSAPSRSDIAYDPGSGILYITSGSELLRWDTDTRTFLKPISIGGDLRGIDLSADGETLAIGNLAPVAPSSGLVLVDTSTAAISSVPGAIAAASVAWCADGSVLFAGGNQWTNIYRYDSSGPTLTSVASIVYQPMLVASGDRSMIVWAELGISNGPVGRYRVSDGEVLRRTDSGTGRENRAVGTSRDGSCTIVPTYFGAYVFDAELLKTGEVIGNYAADFPLGVAFHPTADIVYMSWRGTSTVRAHDATTFEVLDTFDFETDFTWGGDWYDTGRVKVSPSGDRLFALVPGGVRYIELATERRPHFAGTVRNASTGEPLSGIEVRAYDADGLWTTGSGTPVATATTAADGTYRITELEAGRLYVLAYCDLTGVFRDLTWPQAGWHIGDSWACLPAPETGTPGSTDASMTPVSTLNTQRVKRVAGANRYATAFAISRANFASAQTVVLASGATYPDALAASPLAGLSDGPILLTAPNVVDPALLAELRRLKTEYVVIVGGPASVSSGVESRLRSSGFSVRRISGANRYEVASKVALEVYAKTENKEPFVVRGDGFADALSVSPFAHMQTRPILLCPVTGMTPAVRAAWTKMHAGANDTIIFVGGPASITDAMYEGFRSISGAELDENNIWLCSETQPDRYGTGAAVVQFFQNDYYELYGGFDFIGLASGEVFPDALAGGAACGTHSGPMILTPGSRLAAPARATIQASAPWVLNMQVFGGKGTLTNATLTYAKDALGTGVYDIDSDSGRAGLAIGFEGAPSGVAPREKRETTDALVGSLPENPPMRREPNRVR